jgi:hypothetical protein
MKPQKWMGFALISLLGVTLLQSCSKEDELTPQTDQPGWTVRPDFALLDNRPPDVIAQFQVTGEDIQPVELLKSAKGGGKYALVIGISDYEGTANDLSYCDDDATDWKNQLRTEGYTVTALLDRNATKVNILSALTALASQSLEGSEIAFCYSGHGSKGGIVSTDLYYIGSSTFKTIFDNATSTKMFFCFDACQIGAMGTDLYATGRVIALASNKTSYSYDGDATMKNGVFTYYQMIGFDKPLLYSDYLEKDCKYACDQMLLWAKTNKVRVVPSYVDTYGGFFPL